MYLNSESYWEKRFKTDWKKLKGIEQTLIHYKTIITYLPQWMKDVIEKNSYSICDMGCGMGEGSNELHKIFPKSKVYGMDFSQTAIDEANNQYKDENLNYFKGDMCDCDKKFDIIVTSHTLEHFDNPFEIVEKLSQNCKYLIINVPFREYPLWKEHRFTFQYESFPLTIHDKKLIYYKEIAPIFFSAGNYIINEQILVIYANNELVEDFSLDKLNSYYDEKLILQNKLKKLKKENEELAKQNNLFKSTKAYKMWIGDNSLKKNIPNTYEDDESYVNDIITAKNSTGSLSAHNVVMAYKDGSAYNVTLTDVNGKGIANKIINIRIDERIYNLKTDLNGNVSLTINLNIGNYKISAKVENDDPADELEISNTIHIKKPKMSITAEDINMTYKDGTNYNIQLTDKDGHPLKLAGEIIKITLEGKEYNLKTNKEGIASLPINLNIGKYTISAKIEKNDYTDEIEISNTIHIKKPKMSITAEDINMTYKDETNYNVQLINEEGNPLELSNEIIKITLEGNEFNRKTDNRGIASLPINLNVGKYAISAKIEGNDSNNEIKIDNIINVEKPKMSITAEDINMTYKDGTNYNVQLINEEGRPLTLAGEIIKINIGGKEYNLKTDDQGIASLPINLNVGKYAISAKIEGNDSDKEIKIDNIINVEKPKMSITAEDINMTYKDGTNYNVQLINEEGNPLILAGEIIKIKVEGKEYNLKTNTQGIASLPIFFTPGTYEMAAEYNDKLIKSKLVVKKK
ncbi:methyltransferase domain-containing protein [Methanobrevibacter sp.]|uniref:methyltransferase domain-containing protein n=1 Tax=Methanobrevibacter sp. TaxID=66852 RepID=UPI0038900121